MYILAYNAAAETDISAVKYHGLSRGERLLLVSKREDVFFGVVIGRNERRAVADASHNIVAVVAVAENDVL